MNPFESSARSRKVLALVTSIDERIGSVVTGEPALLLAESLRAWPDDAWEQAAELADVNVPSAETRRMVVEVYEGRAKAGAA